MPTNVLKMPLFKAQKGTKKGLLVNNIRTLGGHFRNPCQSSDWQKEDPRESVLRKTGFRAKKIPLFLAFKFTTKSTVLTGPFFSGFYTLFKGQMQSTAPTFNRQSTCNAMRGIAGELVLLSRSPAA